MSTLRRSGAVLAGLAVAVALLAACEANYEVRTTETNLAIPCSGTTNVNTIWAVPQGIEPIGFVWLNHGFARSNDAVFDLQKKYASRGLVVASPSLGAFGGCAVNSAAMHTAIANLLIGATSPGSALEASYDAARSSLSLPAADLPQNYVLSGHSAGGALVTVVGGILNSNPDPAVRARLKGVMLLDPVENNDDGMATNLPKLADKPVYTVSAPNSSCNANTSGTAELLAARSGFVGVRLPSGCHCDAEADTTDILCTLTCGTPKDANKIALKRLAADWAVSMATGLTNTGSFPGGQYFEETKAAGTIVTLTGNA
jgi:hypothetical protein